MPTPRAIEDLAPHDHACLIYTDAADLLEQVTPFLEHGVRLREQCLLILTAVPVGMATVGLAHLSKTLAGAIRCGQLVIDESAPYYAVDAPVDAEAMLSMWSRTIKQAVQRGYQGLRVVAEPDERMLSNGRYGAFVAYERLANNLFVHHPVTAICVYRRSAFTSDCLQQIQDAHPVEVLA